MHPSSVEAPPAASTVAAANPNFLDDLFGPDTGSAPAPVLIGEVIAEVAELADAELPTVAAVVLATLGAALGPQGILNRHRLRHTPGLNVVVSHCCPRSLPWMEAITAPFVGRVFEMQADLFRRGISGIESGNEHRQRGLAQACGTVRPNKELLSRLEAEAGQSQARLKPFVAASGVAPKELAGLLPRSFDHAFTLVAASNDPGVDLQRLKPAERIHLAQLLNRSWTNTPLAFGSAVVPGHLSLLWPTRQSIKNLFGPAGFDAASTVPLLVFADETKAASLPEFEHEAQWDQTIGHLFDARCLGQSTAFTLHPDAEAVLTNFGGHVAETLDSVPASLRAHVDWLPELAARVALIYWVTAGSTDLVVNSEIATAAVKTTKWLGRQHLATLAAAGLADNTDPTDRQARLLAKIRVKAPISRRDLRRCFDNQQVRWFDDALDALLEVKKVRYNEEVLLVPCS